MQVITKIIFILSFFLFSIIPLFARDWSDLEEGEKKQVYGSEKSKKYSASNLLWEIEKWDKHYGVRILYLYDYTDYPKFNSTQLFPFYFRLNSKIDNREKFRFLNYTFVKEKTAIDRSFFPFLFWGNDSNSRENYNATLPIYFFSKTQNSFLDKSNFFFFPIPFYSDYELDKKTQNEESTYAFSLFPFYYSNLKTHTPEKNRIYDKTFWTLFFYRSSIEEKAEFKESTRKSVWGFPVIPLLFYSSYEMGSGNYKRILTLFHWENAPSGKLDAFSFLPFLIYKKDQYFRIPLFLIDKDLSSPDPSHGKTMIPLFLYYHKWSPTSKTVLLGPWFQTKDDISKENLSIAFPFYWNYKSERQDFSLIFPFYANYNDKENDYHVNLIWITRTNAGWINPSLSLGKKDNKWYIDSDFTFLYYLASFSFRQPLEKPKFLRSIWNKKKEAEEMESSIKELESNKSLPQDSNINPKLSRKRSVSRDESFQFSGYSLLFGILSYESADTRRHFRLLPLSWFSWDKESEDKVYVAPLFLWYEAEALEYLVIFPFYGKQRELSSQKKAFLLNTYISETYKEGNWKEHSVIWPIINWYSSDTFSGHRFLPFYIHQTFKNESIETNRNYSLFSYYKNQTSKEFNRTSLFLWFFLSYYNSTTYFTTDTTENKVNQENYTLWITPFFHQSQSTYQKHTNLLWVLDWKFIKNEKSELDRLILFPFYYFSSGFIGIFPISMNRTGSDFWTFTAFNYLHIYENYFYYNFLFLTEFEKSPRNIEINFLARSIQFRKTDSVLNISGLWDYGWIFRKENEIWKDASFLWLGYSKTREETIYNFLPIIRISDSQRERSRIYGPLLLYTSEETDKNFHLGLLGLGYWYNKNESKKEEDLYILFGSIYREYRGDERGFRAKGSLWGWLWEYQKEEETSFEKYSLLKLFSYTKEADGTKKILGISF